jgi:hypothetical protein
VTEFNDAVAKLVACKMVNADTTDIMVAANTIVDIYNNRIETALGIITDLVDVIAEKQKEINDFKDRENG